MPGSRAVHGAEDVAVQTTFAARTHEDLLTGPTDSYEHPEITGYPVEEEDAKIVYRSIRTGELVEANVEIEEIQDDTRTFQTTSPST